MSQKNIRFKQENKAQNPSSYDRNSVFLKSKTNRIIIDSENKNTEIKDEDRSQEINTSKIYSKSNFEKKKLFNNSNIDLEFNEIEMKDNGKELAPLIHKKSSEDSFYNNDTETASVKSLKKKLNELNGEIYKLKNDSHLQNYNILELNYKQKSKELTELKQENNFMRFQLEDLMRKNLRSNNSSINIKNNNFVNSYNKRGPLKLGVRDYHNLLFSKKIKLDEDNKDKNFDEQIRLELYIKKNEELIKQIGISNTELEKYKKKYNAIKNEKEELKLINQRLNKKLTSCRTRTEITEEYNQEENNSKFFKDMDELKHKEKTINDLKKSIEEMQNLLDEQKNKYENDIDELKKKLEDAKEEHDQQMNEFNKTINEKNDYINEIDRLKKVLEEVRKKNYKEENEELKKLIEEMKIAAEEEKNKLINEINDLKNIIEENKKNLTELEIKRNEKENELNELKIKHEELIKSNELKEEEYKNMENLKNNMNEEKEKYSKEIEGQKKRISELESYLEKEKMKTNSLLKLVEEQKTKLNSFKFIAEGNQNKTKKEQLMNEYRKLYSSPSNFTIFEDKRESIQLLEDNNYSGDDLSKLKENNKFLKEKLSEESTKTEVLKVIAGDEKRKIEKVMDKFHQAKNINIELITMLKEKDSKLKKLREEMNNIKINKDQTWENIEKKKMT